MEKVDIILTQETGYKYMDHGHSYPKATPLLKNSIASKIYPISNTQYSPRKWPRAVTYIKQGMIPTLQPTMRTDYLNRGMVTLFLNPNIYLINMYRHASTNPSEIVNAIIKIHNEVSPAEISFAGDFNFHHAFGNPRVPNPIKLGNSPGQHPHQSRFHVAVTPRQKYIC